MNKKRDKFLTEAMSLELLDEIKCYAKTITFYADRQVWIHCFRDEEELEYEDGFIWVSAITLSDAISKALIEWKKKKDLKRGKK